MTRGIDAAGAIQLSARTRPANFVWISDGLLTCTFARFCQRRHGSCVPGPLEARRRASRRKNTSLASPSWGGSHLDPALLAGRGQHVSWWKNDKDLSKLDTKTPKWLSWLLDDAPSLARNPPSISNARAANADTILWDSLDLGSLPRILSQCTTFLEVQEALRRRCINAEHRPKLCQQVLRHLLKQENWALEVAHLLLDPEFHPPGSSLHLEVFSTLESLQLRKESWLRIRHSLCEAARLGIISIEDVRKMIDASYGKEVHLVDTATTVPLEANEIGLLPELLKAVNNSSILSLEDLGKSFLLKSLRKSSKSPNTSSILSILAPWADQRDASMYFRYALDEILRIKSDSPQAEAATIFSTAQLLSRLNPRTLVLALPQVTAQLCCVGNTNGLSAIKVLANWRLTLSQLGRLTNAEFLVAGDFSTMLSHLPDQEQIPALLVTMWTCASLANTDADAQALLNKAGAQVVFQQEMAAMKSAETKDPFGRFTLELSKLPLPNKALLLEMVLPFIHNRSPAAASDPNLEMLIKALVDRRYVILHDRGLYRSLWQNYPYELVDIAESINAHLGLFKALSRKWIHKDERAASVILKLLRHNHGLKLALTQLSRDPKHVPYRIARLYKLTHSPDRLPDAKEALDFIGHLAVSFATTKIRTLSSCENHLNFLYLYLHEHRCPVPPILVQAMWYNGLVRSGKSESPSRHMSRMLDYVSQVEGRHVRGRLESSASFRAQRQRDFEAYARRDDPDHLTKHFADVDRLDDLYWAQGSHWMKDKSSLLFDEPVSSPLDRDVSPDKRMPLLFPTQSSDHPPST